ncbi:phage baseplate assembly protein [uncultured Bradyrhizobium sp.]|uniref:phage baseplate assembly protein domain-containing protein n=1 Tax=uncultured Bradyrhizobium sp. TaxID=199684 RepID=UPI00262D0776|nr:phage baseplate assembly protein [uncultured Bradyrhizobium sp.]
MMQRIFSMIGRGRLMLVKDDKDVQRLQVSEGNTGSDKRESVTDDIAMVGLFGLSSNAPQKSEVLLLRLGGDRSQTIAVGANHRPSRPTNLAPGDTMLYRAKDGARGAYIWLKDGVLQIDAAGGDVIIQNAATATIKASTKVRIEAPKVETTGDFVSRCDGTSVSLNALRDAYHLHKHTGGTISGNTGATDHDV